jgi:hypothetical protein
LVKRKETPLSCHCSQNTRSHMQWAIHYGCMAGSAYCCAEARPESAMFDDVVGWLGAWRLGSIDRALKIQVKFRVPHLRERT